MSSNKAAEGDQQQRGKDEVEFKDIDADKKVQLRESKSSRQTGSQLAPPAMSLKSILNDSSRQSQQSSQMRKPSNVSGVAEQPVNVRVKSEEDESNLDIDEISP